MHRKAGHAIGVAIGVFAVPVLGYLLVRSAVDLDRITAFDQPGPDGTPPFSTSGSLVAAAALAGAAVIAGLLVGTWRLSPLAPLLAGLALTGFGLFGWFDLVDTLRLLNQLPVTLFSGAWDLQYTGLWQVLGGALLASAAMPWRWTGRRAAFWPYRGTLGVLIGVVGLPALWYLIQLANPVGYGYAVFSAHFPLIPYLYLLPQLAAAVVIGVLAAAWRVSPVAAAITGLPLLAVGLGLVLAPTGTSQGAAHFVLGGHPLAFGVDQSVSFGAYLLFGGMLVVSAALPWRWRRPGATPAPDPAPAISEAV